MQPRKFSTLAFAAAVFLFVALAVPRTGHAQATGSLPLVSLSADNLPEGALDSWTNAGSLAGSFTNDATNPKVETVAGVKAVTFSGRDRMLASFAAPESITGSKPWSCVVRAFNPRLTGEETMVSWASRPNNSLQIEYGSSRQFGAVGTYNDPNTLGWTNAPPAAGQWHTLVYTYSGGPDGILRAYCDGQLQVEKMATLNTKSNGAFLLGACITTRPLNRQTQPFSGSLAMVQVYDRALAPLEVWTASGMQAALPVSPAAHAVLQTRSTKLAWQAGTAAARSFDVYFSQDRDAVAKADNSPSAVFKGNQPASTTEFALNALEIGKSYYWRVDERDTDGKVAWPGEIRDFSLDDGKATAPSPADAWPIPAGTKPTLTWKPGAFARSQNFYFGEDLNDVRNRAKPDSSGLAADAATTPIPTSDLQPGKTYYWRVDQVTADNAVIKGDVWSFRMVSRKLRVYLLGGQSNMTGCTTVNGLTNELRNIQKNIIIYATGGLKVGTYGWGFLKPGLGQDYNDDDGHGTFGPEITFGHDMAEARPNEIIALVKCGWGGTDLAVQWRPPSAGGRTGPLYRNFVAAMHQGLSKLDSGFEPEICGMIWMQGEEDAQNANGYYASYETNLTCFIHDIRAEFKRPDLPFVFGQISTVKTYDPPRHGAEVRAAQVAVSQKVPHTATFETGDYKLHDQWHYDANGMMSLGQRFAKGMLELEKDAVPKPGQ